VCARAVVCYAGIWANSDGNVKKKNSCRLCTTVRGTIVFSQYFNFKLCKVNMNRVHIKQNGDLTVPSGSVMHIVTVEPEGFVARDGEFRIMLLSCLTGFV
jgi:hypothetical protein